MTKQLKLLPAALALLFPLAHAASLTVVLTNDLPTARPSERAMRLTNAPL